jgi:hypothetical protein
MKSEKACRQASPFIRNGARVLGCDGAGCGQASPAGKVEKGKLKNES